MFYTDEVRSLGPLAWLAAACLAFWGLMFYAWPIATGVFLAIIIVLIVVYSHTGGRHGR